MPTDRLATSRGGKRSWGIGSGVTVLAVLPLLAQGTGVRAGAQDTLPPGDAARGRALFESSRCADCHRIAETGSRLGPDLSDIGDRRSPDVLERAIVEPDAEVLPENRFVRVVTKDGVSVVGRLLNQDAFSIQLFVDEQLKSYLKSNLREFSILQKGLMPSSEGKLTRAQVADIVSYLASLKGAEK